MSEATEMELFATIDSAGRRICRICMQDELIMDWNEKLYKFSGTSYRDCYYKYTQLEDIVSDPFPQFLCEACSTDLKKCHLLIEKALETQKVLKQWLTTSYDCLAELKDDQYPEESESGQDHEIECVYMVENDDDRSADFQEAPTDKVDEKLEIEYIEVESKKVARKSRKCVKSALSRSIDSDDNSEENYKMETLKSPRKTMSSKKEKGLQRTQQEETTTIEDSDTKGKTKANTPVMCSFCSKIIHNAYYLKKHEQTHQEDREREVTCSKCGLKTFTKKALYIHMKIHDKNREKKFKCEFCDKAFFHRGACNVHRRIHLGQMVKCPICPKEFYRQVDLERHMQTHSHTPLHSAKLQSKLKYVVHCKECNKEINSAKFNAHRAAHMNEPLMRCTVCEKDFFSRMSCTRHMRRVHKRAKDNYDDITTYYEKYRPRLSHVLMEQQEEVEAK